MLPRALLNKIMKNSQTLRFHKYYPGGNPTILVENFDGNIPRERYGELATKLMGDAYIGAEQVGYLETPGHSLAAGRLHMMGGELCVNALRCMAHYLAERMEGQSFSVETSGAGFLVSLEVKNDEVTVCLPNNFYLRSLSDTLSMVELPGILHFVVLCSEIPSQEVAETTFTDIRNRYHDDIRDQGAIGAIFLKWGAGNPSILPIIYVTASSTLVTETSCGSGSMAAFFVLHKKYDCHSSLVMQPSGTPLKIKIEQNTIHLQGSVQKTVSGEIYTSV